MARHAVARRSAAVPVAIILALTTVVLVMPSGPRLDVVEVPRLLDTTVVPVTSEDNGLFGTVSAVTEPGIAFSTVAVDAPMGASVDLDVRLEDGSWAGWRPLLVEHVHAEDGHGPDGGQDDHADHDDHADPLDADAALPDRTASDPVFVGHATALRVRVTEAAPEDLLVTVADAHGVGGGPTDRVVVEREPLAAAAAASVPMPSIIRRGEWGAQAPNEDIEHATAAAYVEVEQNGGVDNVSDDGDTPYVDLGPEFDVLGAGVVHHTAGNTSYDQGDVAGIMRSIQSYHQNGRGWADIGYNFVVDRFGRIWEGRAGGIDRAVIGAHSGGWNTSSFGVAMLGDFRGGAMPTQAAVDAVADLFAWKFDLHGVDPAGRHTWPNGQTRGTVVGHGDLVPTTCPGDARTLLPQLREMVAERLASGVAATDDDVLAAPDHGGRFTDVDPNAGSTGTAVYALADAGVIAGCRADAFCPDGTLTRGEVVSFLGKAYGVAPNGTGNSIFDDVDPDGAIGPWVDALVATGVIQGFPDGTFRGTQPVTRGELITLLGRIYGLQPVAGDVYPDVNGATEIGGMVNAMTDVGFVGSCDGSNFCVDDPMSRAQTVDLIYIALTYGDRLGLTARDL